MLKPLPNEDKTYESAQSALQKVSPEGKAPKEMKAHLEEIKTLVAETFRESFDYNRAFKEGTVVLRRSNNTPTYENGEFCLLDSAEGIQDAVVGVVQSHVLGIDKAKEKDHATDGCGLLDQNGNPDRDALKRYIASVTRSMCNNLIAVSGLLPDIEDNDRMEVASNITRYHGQNFAWEYFGGNMVQDHLGKAGYEVTEKETEVIFPLDYRAKLLKKHPTDYGKKMLSDMRRWGFEKGKQE
jgi:hypothetical protein